MEKVKTLEVVKLEYILSVLYLCKGNVGDAAELLNISVRFISNAKRRALILGALPSEETIKQHLTYLGGKPYYNEENIMVKKSTSRIFPTNQERLEYRDKFPSSTDRIFYSKK